MTMDTDILIVGGGPAGLSFARSLAGSGLRLTVLERQSREALADPPYDGREIALTHRSIRSLKELGAWDRIADEHKSPLRSARVLNGGSPLALTFDTGESAQGELGVLVPNQQIRRALFDSVDSQDGLEMMCGVTVSSARSTSAGGEVTLADGTILTSRLLVAADSRLSFMRGQLGIGAEINRLGRAMLVCRVEHDREHDHVATEWFDVPHTIAMLPLNGRFSSAVITLPQDEAERLAASTDDALGEAITAMYRGRLGSMRVAGSWHLYPLVTTFARRFAAPGAALIGDTAVGMHPVTAHGFNLGLQGARTLAKGIAGALRRGEDWGGEPVLAAFEQTHRLASRPIYTATNLIVRLYGDARPAAQVARHAAIRLSRRLPFVKSAVRSMLLQS
jgi:ubiquinone biosynthesis UbiH/UbiF/VisC/COQ6 family hydroxylase